MHFIGTALALFMISSSTTRALRRLSLTVGGISCSSTPTPMMHMQMHTSSRDVLPPNTVIVLAGATSVGKSSVAMELCRRLDAEIVIADSVQVYRHLDIGSNKPSITDRLTPHHLVDIAEPADTLSTGDFTRLAAEAVRDVLSRGKVVVVVGGSTMWVQWLVQGVPDAPKASKGVVQRVCSLLDALEADGRWDEGVGVLEGVDAERAAKLCRNDWYRLRRYLEVGLDMQAGAGGGVGATEITGRVRAEGAAAAGAGAVEVEENGAGPTLRCSPSLLVGTRTPVLSLAGLSVGQTQTQEPDVRTFFITEERTQLYRTIDARCAEMLHMGLLDEVARCVLEGVLTPEVAVSRAIGYRQAIAYLGRQGGGAGDAEAFRQFVKEFCTSTRNYAKRQMNWYRKDPMFLFLQTRRAAHKDSKVHKTQTKDIYAHSENTPISHPSSTTDTNAPKDSAASRLADEVLHWAAAPRSQFESALLQQVQMATAVTDLRRGKRVPWDYAPDSATKRLALAYCVHMGLLPMPTPAPVPVPVPVPVTYGAGAGAGTGAAADTGAGAGDAGVAEYGVPAWVEALLDPNKGITPSDIPQLLAQQQWSAEGIDIRTPDGVGAKSDLRTYVSHVTSDTSLASFETVLASADLLKEKLLEEKAEVMRAFVDNKHFSERP